jgi:hypothetical protein
MESEPRLLQRYSAQRCVPWISRLGHKSVMRTCVTIPTASSPLPIQAAADRRSADVGRAEVSMKAMNATLWRSDLHAMDDRSMARDYTMSPWPLPTPCNALLKEKIST